MVAGPFAPVVLLSAETEARTRALHTTDSSTHSLHPQALAQLKSSAYKNITVQGFNDTLMTHWSYVYDCLVIG